MKKTLALLLTGMMVFSVAGCKDSGAAEPVDASASGVVSSQPAVSEQESTNQKPWGVEDMITARNSNGTATFFVSFPELLGTLQGGGVAAEQPNGILIIADGQDTKTPEDVTKVADVFPAYFVQAQSVLRGYYRTYAGKDYNFEIADKREVKINGHDMVMFSGTLAYEYDREPMNCNWVAYATQVDENGAYAYWMVIDDVRGVKADVDIADVALKMAHSYREQ